MTLSSYPSSNRRKPWPNRRAAKGATSPQGALAFTIAALLPLPLLGTDAVKTWDAGSATNFNFRNTTNWDPNGTPTFAGNTDAVVFNGTQHSGNPNIVFNIDATNEPQGYVVKSFTFNTTGNPASYAYTFSGAQTLILGDTTTGGTTQPNTGFLTNNSSGTQTFNINGTASSAQPYEIGFSFGGINAAAGAFVFGANANIEIGNQSNAAGRDVLVTGAFNTTINSQLVGLGDAASAGGTLNKTGAGTLFLNGDSAAWNGRITISGGASQINKTNSLGTAAGRTTISGGTDDGRLAITGGINVAENFVLGGRTSASANQIVNVSGNNSLTGTIALDSGGAEYALSSTAGTLNVLGDISYGTATGATTLNLGGAGNGSIASSLGAGGLAISVSKSGAGTWTLSGAANAYTGTTTVAAGRLNIATAQTGGGAVSIGDGATLGVSLAAVGQSLSVSALTLGATTGGTLALELGSFGNPTVAIVNAGSFTVNGANTLALKAGGLALGQFPLIDYSGAIGGSGFTGIALGTLPARITANLVDDAANTRVLLNVSAFDIPKWIGGVDGNWDIDDGSGTGTANWREAISGNTTRYLQGAGGTDSVLFDDTVGVPSAVNLTATLTPASITVNTSSNAFTFTGAGKLSGATSLLKQGSSTLTLLNSGGNDYTGATTLATGTIQVGDGATAGAGQLGSGPIVNHGTLIINRPDALTIAGDLSGNGALNKQAAGTLTLSGNNASFTGPVAVAEGTLRLGSVDALAGVSGVTVQSGATFDLGGRALNVGQIVTIGGAGAGGIGALVNTGAQTIGLKNLVLAGAATLGGTGRFDIADNPGGFNAGGHTLTKLGTNTIFLTNLGETNLGNVVLSAGRISFAGNTTLGSQPGTVQINGGQLGFEDSTVVHTKNIAFNGGGLYFPTGTGNQLSGNIALLDVYPNTLNPVTNLFQGTGNLTVSGVISGPGGFSKAAAGALILTGTNTYAGLTTVTGGVVRATDGVSLGAGNLVLNGGTFETGVNFNRPLGADNGQVGLIGGNSGFSAAGGNVSVDLSGTGNGADFTIQWGANPDFSPAVLILNQSTATHALTFTNSLDLNGAGRQINVNAGHAVITGVLSGNSAGLTKAGQGTLTLASANSYTAGTTITAGTLRLGHAQAIGATPAPLTVNGATLDLNGHSLTVTSLTANSTGIIADSATTPGITKLTVDLVSGSSTFTGKIGDGANGRVLALEKSGAGTLVLNGPNALTYTGGTTIGGGRLDVRTNNAQVLPLGSDLTFTGTATFAAANNGAGATSSLVLGDLSVLAGQATIEANKLNATAVAGTTTFAAPPTRANGATVNFTLVNTADPSLFKVAFTSAPTAERSLNSGVYFGGKNFATYDAAGFVRAVNYTADSNAVNVTPSVAQETLGAVTDKDVQLGGDFAITAQPSETVRSLRVSGATNLTLEAGATLTTSALLKADDGIATISGGLGLTSGGAGDFVVRVDGANDTLVLATPILASTTGGLTKGGSGRLVLGAANTFSGGVWINSGPLEIASGGSIANAGEVTVEAGSSLIVSGSLSGVTDLVLKPGAFLGGGGTIAGAGSGLALTLSGGASLAPGASSGALTFDLGSGSLDLSAASAGSGWLKFDLGTASDVVAVTSGTLDLGGDFDLSDFTFTDAGGFAPGRYVLFNTTAEIAGTLGVNVSGTVLGFDATLGFSGGVNGRDDLVLTVVPEPGSFASFLGGLGTLLGFQRHRRARRP